VELTANTIAGRAIKMKKVNSIKTISLTLAFVMLASYLMIPELLTSANEINVGINSEQLASFEDTRNENEQIGLIGFDGDYELSDDNTPVSVIVLFNSDPAAIQVLDAQERGGRLSAVSAEGIVEREHDLFRTELNHLFGSQSANQPFEIRWEYRQALNGVSITLPSNRVEDVADFNSVRVIYPNFIEEFDMPEPMDNSATSSDPQGMAPGRATMRANEMHDMGYRGEGVVIAVFDTGIDYNHPAFAGSFLTLEQMQERNPDVTMADTINGYFKGRNFLETPNDPMDVDGHGTHVAGTIAGRDSGRSVSILGVAPEAHMIHYRVIEGWTALDNVLAGIEMTAYDRPDIVNLSLGFATFHPDIWHGAYGNTPLHLTSLAVNNIKLSHPYITFVIAAGNEGDWFENYSLRSPGTATRAITVASADVDMTAPIDISRFSSLGPVDQSFEIKPDIAAHGSNVLSAVPTWFGSNYEWWSGTSMAAPHITGAVALLIEYSRDNGGQWNAEEIKSRLMNTAAPFGSEVSVFETGSGYVDVYAAAHAETSVFVTYDRVAHQPGISFIDQDFYTARTASFSFGSGNQLLYPILDSYENIRTLSAAIENNSNDERTYTIEYNFTNNPESAAKLTLSRRTITIPPEAIGYFSATMSVSGNVDGGFYEGYVHVRDATTAETVARLPFALVNEVSTDVSASILSFELGATNATPTTIDAINVNHGTSLDYFVQTYHQSFTYRYGGMMDGVPTRPDYIFQGWYLDSNFTTPLTETTAMPTTAMTLYARWTDDDHLFTPREILSGLIAEAEDIARGNYTPLSWARLQSMLVLSRRIYNNPTATAAQINEAIDLLGTRLDALIER